MEDDLFGGGEKSGKITFQRSWALDSKSQFKFWYWHLPARVSPLAFPISRPGLSFTSKMGTSNGAVLMGQGTVLYQVPSYS